MITDFRFLKKKIPLCVYAYITYDYRACIYDALPVLECCISSLLYSYLCARLYYTIADTCDRTKKKQYMATTVTYSSYVDFIEKEISLLKNIP